jgi:phage tail-like protein
MRGLVEELQTPHALGPNLPSILQEDDFCQRFVSAFDAVLAPVFCVLDNLDAYLDPYLAPEDFLEWLASWVGLTLDETWPVERLRSFVSGAVNLYSHSGTSRGLAAYLEIFAGRKVDVLESGATAWSSVAGGELPGYPTLGLLVRVTGATEVDVQGLEVLVTALKPAHMPHRIDLVKQ